MRAALLALALFCSVPALAQRPAPPAGPAARKAELDRLFAALAAAPDEVAGAAVEARIRAAWAQAATPAVLLLMQRGRRNLQVDADADAVEDFDAVLALQPDYADAWLARAAALHATGDEPGAAADVQQALRLEPRRFDALDLLARFQEQAGDHAGALRSLRAALLIHPRLANGEERARLLRDKAEGRPT